MSLAPKKYRFIRLEVEHLPAGWGAIRLTLGLRRYRYDWGYSQLFTRVEKELSRFHKQLENSEDAEMTLQSEPGKTKISAQIDPASGWIRLEALAKWPGEDPRRDLSVLCAPNALRRAVARALTQSSGTT